MSEIPVISLWQPFASLIFELRGGVPIKQHETRGREPPLKYIGGFIGVHATAKFPPLRLIGEELHELCMDTFGCSYNYSLPQGAILGVARLSGGLSTAERRPADDADRIAGDWSEGRFAWPLSDVQKFAIPIPAKGKQGWWKFSPEPMLSRVGGSRNG